MAEFEKRLPMWNAPGIEPPLDKTDEGWKKSERPPAEYMNFLHYTTFEALKELQEFAAHQSVIQAIEDATKEVENKNNEHSLLIDIFAKRNSGGVSVLEFGADSTGITVSTKAFQDALAYCEANKKNLIIPDGNFWITEPLIFPNYFKILGNGFGTNIIADLPSGNYVFTDLLNFRYGAGIENVRFTVKTGGIKKVGAIALEKAMRGLSLQNIWTYDMYQPLYLGSSIWGVLSIDNWYSYLLNDKLIDQSIIGLHLKGNTTYINNIEIVGGWDSAFVADGCDVFEINNFNIAGSKDTQMRRAIRIKNAKNFTISKGWIEQLDDAYWPNGEAESMYFENSINGKVSNVKCASGSIFSDASDIKIENITYSQANAGLRYKNNGKFTTDKTALGKQNVQTYPKNSDGVVEVLGVLPTPIGLLSNPLFKKGISHKLSVTNGSLVTLTDELSDFATTDRSIKVSSLINYQGAMILQKVMPEEIYTVVVKVKNGTNISDLQINYGTETSTVTSYPSTLKRSNQSGWYDLIYVCRTTKNTSTLNVRIEAVLTDPTKPGEFFVDSADVFPGYNPFDLKRYTLEQLGKSGRLQNYRAPIDGAWEQGLIITIDPPVVGGYKEQVCLASGTPGTWKGVGTIQT